MKKKPYIERIDPPAALPGGEVRIEGQHFMTNGSRSVVAFDDQRGHLVACADRYLVATVPPEVTQGEIRVILGSLESDPVRIVVATLLADNLHPVSNPVVDKEGNIFSTFSGSRGQKVETSVYKISQGVKTSFISDLMNASGLAFNSEGELFVSSRFDGMIYRVLSPSNLEVYAKGMGVATGMVFDAADNLFVGDRSGTVFKIDTERKIFVFATLEPSVSAYHMTFDADGNLYVTGPTIGCFDSVHRISTNGEVGSFFSGLGRPQGMAFDPQGNLLVAASLHGLKGIVRITPDLQVSTVVSGAGIVGLALDPTSPADLIVATQDSLFRLKMAWASALSVN
ncbi:MAG: gluconolaconase [Acidobacteriia bacterium]|nr:gluconolaconase [Terriglobia bacterium]